MTRCKDCEHWDKESEHAVTNYGQCLLASESGWDGPMKAWDIYDPKDPHLLTREDFWCAYGRGKI